MLQKQDLQSPLELRQNALVILEDIVGTDLGLDCGITKGMGPHYAPDCRVLPVRQGC